MIAKRSPSLRIISKAILRQFWGQHPETESPLNAWHRNVELADWSSPADVRNTYRNADIVGCEFAVFNICHNDYRLVVRVDYGRGKVYVYGVYTHADYDRLDLVAIDRDIKRDLEQRRAEREGR
jgi:mRNA interferase HigB